MKTKLPETVWLAAVLGLVIGGWMLFDGSRCLIYGDYFRINGQLGPWEKPVVAAGINPQSLSPIFLLLGIAWVASSAGLLLRKRWAWFAALVLSIITLLYCCIGTAFSVLTLACLLLSRTRMAFKSEVD